MTGNGTLPLQHLKGDPKQDEPTGNLERGNGDPEVIEQGLAQKQEAAEDEEGTQASPESQTPLRAGREPGRQGQERKDIAQGINNDDQGD